MNSPATIGIAVCTSTDPASVRRRAPTAATTASGRRRSWICSTATTSRLLATSAKVINAPIQSPWRAWTRELASSSKLRMSSYR